MGAIFVDVLRRQEALLEARRGAAIRLGGERCRRLVSGSKMTSIPIDRLASGPARDVVARQRHDPIGAPVLFPCDQEEAIRIHGDVWRVLSVIATSFMARISAIAIASSIRL